MTVCLPLYIARPYRLPRFSLCRTTLILITPSPTAIEIYLPPNKAYLPCRSLYSPLLGREGGGNNSIATGYHV